MSKGTLSDVAADYQSLLNYNDYCNACNNFKIENDPESRYGMAFLLYI